jgi:hypothetical protein
LCDAVLAAESRFRPSRLAAELSGAARAWGRGVAAHCSASGGAARARGSGRVWSFYGGPKCLCRCGVAGGCCRDWAECCEGEPCYRCPLTAGQGVLFRKGKRDYTLVIYRQTIGLGAMPCQCQHGFEVAVRLLLMNADVAFGRCGSTFVPQNAGLKVRHTRTVPPVLLSKKKM